MEITPGNVTELRSSVFLQQMTNSFHMHYPYQWLCQCIVSYCALAATTAIRYRRVVKNSGDARLKLGTHQID